jgi:hypothetical protein
MSNQDGYTTLVLVLCHYIDKGWTVHVFPWAVGIRNPSLIVSMLTFLEFPSKHNKAAVEGTVLASVKSLYFMDQVRFAGMHGRKRATDNQQNRSSDDKVTNDEELRRDPSVLGRNKLAQAAGRKPAEPQ